MTFSKKISFPALFFAFVFAVFAQDMSVEDAYLQATEAVKIISQLASSPNRSQKETALEYIEDRIEQNSATDDDRRILADLTMDGIVNQVRENGKVINKFFDVRLRAVELLGRIKTQEAKYSLINVCELEEDPFIISKAVEGLTEIGIADDSDDTLNAVSDLFRRYNMLNPDNRLANSVVSCIETFNANGLIRAPQGRSRCLATLYLISAPDNSRGDQYIYPVRARAANTAKNLQVTAGK
jgi:hypothetical protein